MKSKLLLYLTSESNPAKNAIAATLAWAAESAGWFFEVYYDAYRLGEHYGGGDPAWQPPGALTGGTMVGGHHHERLYLLLHRFETLALMDGPVAFGPTLEQLEVPRLMVSGFADIYLRAFEALGLPLPETGIVLDAQPRRDLAGVDAYLYPEVAARSALGLEISSITIDDLSRLADAGLRALHPLLLGAEGQQKLADWSPTANLELPGPLDVLKPDDDFASITGRVARRWIEALKGGWVLADPTAVAAWIPDAWRDQRLAIYSKPQRVIIQRLEDELRARPGRVATVLGRQYEDADFFLLSSLGLPFQLIDPCRPPFPVLRLAGYHWTASGSAGATPVLSSRDAGSMLPTAADQEASGTSSAPASRNAGVPGIAETGPDDEQLRAWAREGRVLVSIIFWTGMIRELENLPRVVDLVALTRVKGGLALTLPALEYQPEAPLELLRVPLERGGVFPHLELLLASCGLGATIESRMPEGWLANYLRATNAAFDRLGIPPAWRPQGWWATMDAEMLPLPKPRLPITPKFQARAPFLQLRYQSPGGQQAPAPASLVPAEGTAGLSTAARRPGFKRQMGDWVRAHGLRAILAPYRPYEFFAPGPLRKEVIEALRGAGLRYWFSKAGFGHPPTVLYQDADVIALNYTVGQWDGWTPFETINSVADLRYAERRLLAMKRPGWLVGTLDTCLWAFTGPIWERAPGLRAIADFVARGGDSRRLINVTPGVIARYARLLQQ